MLVPITTANASLLLNARLAVDSPLIDINRLNKEVALYASQENGTRAIVYMLDGQVAGYVEIILWDKEFPKGAPLIPELGNFAHITKIGVVESARRLGVGRRLLEEVESWVRLKGVKGIWLDYLPHSIPAARFWMAHGYEDKAQFTDAKKRYRRIATKNL